MKDLIILQPKTASFKNGKYHFRSTNKCTYYLTRKSGNVVVPTTTTFCLFLSILVEQFLTKSVKLKKDLN